MFTTSWRQEAKIGFEPLKVARGPLPAYDKMRAEAKGWCAELAFSASRVILGQSLEESSRVATTLVAQFRGCMGRQSTLSREDARWFMVGIAGNLVVGT